MSESSFSMSGNGGYQQRCMFSHIYRTVTGEDDWL